MKEHFYVAMNLNNKAIIFADGNILDDEQQHKDSVVYLNHICFDECYRNWRIVKILLK